MGSSRRGPDTLGHEVTNRFGLRPGRVGQIQQGRALRTTSGTKTPGVLQGVGPQEARGKTPWIFSLVSAPSRGADPCLGKGAGGGGLRAAQIPSEEMHSHWNPSAHRSLAGLWGDIGGDGVQLSRSVGNRGHKCKTRHPWHRPGEVGSEASVWSWPGGNLACPSGGATDAWELREGMPLTQMLHKMWP